MSALKFWCRKSGHKDLPDCWGGRRTLAYPLQRPAQPAGKSGGPGTQATSSQAGPPQTEEALGPCVELPSPACTTHAAVLLGVRSPWPPSGSLQAENKEEEKTDSKFKVKRLKILSPDVIETSSSRVSALNPRGPPSPPPSSVGPRCGPLGVASPGWSRPQSFKAALSTHEGK